MAEIEARAETRAGGGGNVTLAVAREMWQREGIGAFWDHALGSVLKSVLRGALILAWDVLTHDLRYQGDSEIEQIFQEGETHEGKLKAANGDVSV